jgi:hypothetical protein
MTIKELLGLSASEFLSLSDDQINAYLAPYIVHARPSENKKFESKEIIQTKQKQKTQEDKMKRIMSKNPMLAMMMGKK